MDLMLKQIKIKLLNKKAIQMMKLIKYQL